ncbi:MAG: Choline-binding repeat [Oscillospiraceae bacterium]|jgi:glucan-binding YG repeat protein|nr:Choline-binding repeat [Oscillospiraceae bacterium]
MRKRLGKVIFYLLSDCVAGTVVSASISAFAAATTNNSVMLTNAWKKINSKWYYFDKDGYMLSSTTKKLGKKAYKFDKNGICLNP